MTALAAVRKGVDDDSCADDFFPESRSHLSESRNECRLQ